MTLSLDAQRTALAAWLADARVREALDRKDWRTAFGTYPRLDLTETLVPWATPPASLRQARVMLVSSSGLYASGQQPFDAGARLGDATWRVLGADLNLGETALAHEHYDHTPAEQDRNVVFPLDRLHELVQAGEIGALTSHQLSFMGYQPDWADVLDQVAPALARQVAAEHPDAVLLVPV